MTVHSLRTRALLVSPIRLVLGVILLVAARAGGAESGPALLAFVLGGLGIAFLIFNDPRARFAEGDGSRADPRERLRPPHDQHRRRTAPRAGRAVLRSGVCAGLGPASLISLARIDPRLYANPEDPRRLSLAGGSVTGLPATPSGAVPSRACRTGG